MLHCRTCSGQCALSSVLVVGKFSISSPATRLVRCLLRRLHRCEKSVLYKSSIARAARTPDSFSVTITVTVRYCCAEWGKRLKARPLSHSRTSCLCVRVEVLSMNEQTNRFRLAAFNLHTPHTLHSTVQCAITPQ